MFWTSIGISIIFFLGLFLVFLLLASIQKKSLRGLPAAYDIKKDVSPREFCLIILLSLLCIVSFILLQSAFVEFFVYLGYNQSQSNVAIDTFYKYLVALIVMAVLPAVVEELLFRGVILQGLMRFGPITAVIVSAMLFSLFHLSLSQTVYQFILGIIFAVLYLRTRNLTYPILLHFFNNAFTLTVMYAMNDGGDDFTFNSMSTASLVILAVIGSAAIIGILMLFRRHRP